MDVEQLVKDRAARLAAQEQTADEIVTLSVIGDDGGDYEIRAHLIARLTRGGHEWVRWEPVGRLRGALAMYNGWSKGALTLPATRIVGA